MENVNVISSEEELVLISQGIDKLIAEGVDHTRKNILDILMQYPSLKKEKFADANFKQTIFTAFKLHFKKAPDTLRYTYTIIEDYCKQFPFLINMTLKDKEAQDKLLVTIAYEIEWLGRSSQYNDDECTKYTNDRMGSLFTLEKIYASLFVSQKTKQSQLLGLKRALHLRYQSRHDGPRLKRIHDLAKSAGVKDQAISDIMIDVRTYNNGRFFGWEPVCDPKLLEYKEFPKEEITSKEAQNQIRSYWMKHIVHGRMDTIKEFITAYPFLKKKMKTAEDVIHADKKEGENYDVETAGLLGAVTEGMKKALSLLNNERAEELKTYFADIQAAIPRKDIIEGIYEGLKTIPTNNDIILQKNVMLTKFPLTKEEAATFVKNNMGDIKTFENNLQYFPDFDFSQMFADPEVKEILFSRIVDKTLRGQYPEKIIFLKNHLKMTQEEMEKMEDKYIEHFINGLKKAVGDLSSMRSRGIQSKMQKLREACTDKEKYKKNIYTEEVKSLLLAGIKSRICDYQFSECFGKDSDIQEVCSHPSFPLKPEDIDKKVMEIFLEIFKTGNMSYEIPNYACIKKNIDAKNPEVIEAGVEGLLTLLNPSNYANAHDDTITSRSISISFLVRGLPFLKDERKKEKIQNALMTLKKHFLSQGRVLEMNKFNEKIENFLA